MATAGGSVVRDQIVLAAPNSAAATVTAPAIAYRSRLRVKIRNGNEKKSESGLIVCDE